jgi:hypothetical protein
VPRADALRKLSRNLTIDEKKASTPKKKNARRSVMIVTMTEVAIDCLRVGQWTFAVSART